MTIIGRMKINSTKITMSDKCKWSCEDDELEQTLNFLFCLVHHTGGPCPHGAAFDAAKKWLEKQGSEVTVEATAIVYLQSVPYCLKCYDKRTKEQMESKKGF